MNDKNSVPAQGRPPIWFWVVSGLALLWNLGGVAAFVQQMMDLEGSVAAIPEESREAVLQLLRDTPAWVTVAFAVAVFGGVLGSIGLLARQKWALWMFALSLVGVVVQQSYTFLMTDMMSLLQTTDLILPAMVLVIDAALVGLACWASRRGWLV